MFLDERDFERGKDYVIIGTVKESVSENECNKTIYIRFTIINTGICVCTCIYILYTHTLDFI